MCVVSFLLAMHYQLRGEEKICVVLLTDEKYYDRFQETYKMLRNEGRYSGEVCLVVAGSLTKERVREKYTTEELELVQFPEIKVDEIEYSYAYSRDKLNGQIQKFYLFDPYFKRWQYILYIDCGMKIHQDISPILELRKRDKLVALSNAYPNYVWTLEGQFPGIRDNQNIKRKFDLSGDYFQTTMMLYDTNIINRKIVNKLIKLKNTYKSGSSDQSYIALYFTQIQPCWEHIPIKNGEIYYYDWYPREIGAKYIMHKYSCEQYPCKECEKM